MKKFNNDFIKPPKEKLISLLNFYKARQYFEAEKLSLAITKKFPEHQFAWKVLGAVLKQVGKIEESLIANQKSLELMPQDREAHNNLGVTLQELGRFKEAEVSFRKAILLKTDDADAYNNLGNILKKLNRFNEAEENYRKAIQLNVNSASAYNNLGNILKDKGELLAAIDSYKQALNIQSNSVEAWNNIFFALQAIKLQVSFVKDYLPFLNENISCHETQIAKSILNYRLNIGNLNTDDSIEDIFNVMSLANNTLVRNTKIHSNELIKPNVPKKITALIHFGRSGTGLLHSLIDGHPEISSLPSIYFSEFFDYFTWKKIIAGEWDEMADRFSTIYGILFDSSLAMQIPSKNGKFIHNLGLKEGMTNVGNNRNEILSLDKKVFIKELKRLLDSYNSLDALTFFELVHEAYEITLLNENKKEVIFYHIHNPDTYALLNFLRLSTNANWIMMVREPIQSCESWIKKDFDHNNYKEIVNKIYQMLFDIDQHIFQNKNSIGVRLEDLKKHPKKTISSLCGWLGIKENECLYKMTTQNKKWWGDPSSPDYRMDGMKPFDKNSSNRKLGLVFSETDQFIFRTLFYPFSVRFEYAQENVEQFKKDLLIIKPKLNKLFDFEKKIIQDTGMNAEKFMKTGSFLFLRSGMTERWNTLNKHNTYPNMLTPLKIN